MAKKVMIPRYSKDCPICRYWARRFTKDELRRMRDDKDLYHAQGCPYGELLDKLGKEELRKRGGGFSFATVLLLRHFLGEPIPWMN